MQCTGEGHDRNSTAFGGHQYALAAALAPVSHGRLICVFVHGGAMALGSLATDCDAILDSGFPGAQVSFLPRLLLCNDHS